MGHQITDARAAEILDSRSQATVEAFLEVDRSTVRAGSVPCGASRGSGEAVEARGGDPARYGGAGVRGIVETHEGEIANAIIGPVWDLLEDLDGARCTLDGPADQGRLGANVIIGVSMAGARALAASDGMPLDRWLSSRGSSRLPVPRFNVINGGLHAKSRMDLRGFVVAPVGAASFAEALRAGAELYARLRDTLARMGLAPPSRHPRTCSTCWSRLPPPSATKRVRVASLSLLPLPSSEKPTAVGT